MRDLDVVWHGVTALTPYARNSRTHSDEQVAQVAASIKEFGWTNPILIDEGKSIIAGHGRLQAAQRLGEDKVPTITLTGLTDAQKRAYVIADNKLAPNAGWDEEMLKIEINDLLGEGFDIDLMGFDPAEIDALLSEPDIIDAGLKEEDDVPDAEAESVSVEGDIWLLGRHRVMCGDSISVDALDALLDGSKPDLVFTDPPYGIDINFGANYASSAGNGAANRQDYGKILNDTTTQTAEDFISLCFAHYDCTLVFWGANYYPNMPPSKCWLSWFKKDDLPPDTFCDTELAWTNSQKHSKTIPVQWKGMIKQGETGQKRLHPTQKPIELCVQSFDYLDAGKVVLDAFGGSGSTLIACEKTARAARIMELDPKYVDVIVKRWQAFTGKDAVHADSGQTFNEIVNG